MKTLESKIKKVTGVYLDRYEILKTQKGDLLQTIVPIIKLKEEMFEKLKAFILTYTFTSADEEIYFFKEIKPKLFSRLLYYKKLHRFELMRPKGSIEAQLRHIEKELNRLTEFFEENLDFYMYYRSGETHLDRFFLRGNCFLQSQSDLFQFECDMSFSSCFDRKVAKLLANEQVQDFLNEEMQRIQEPSGLGKEPFNFKCKETWARTQADLVELTYAICETGCFGQGVGRVKRLTAYFENVFNFKIGDPYHTYSELKRRSNRCQFLDELKVGLLAKMDADDRK
jgi:hypothetical protein